MVMRCFGVCILNFFFVIIDIGLSLFFNKYFFCFEALCKFQFNKYILKLKKIS